MHAAIRGGCRVPLKVGNRKLRQASGAGEQAVPQSRGGIRFWWWGSCRAATGARGCDEVCGAIVLDCDATGCSSLSRDCDENIDRHEAVEHGHFHLSCKAEANETIVDRALGG